jgi:hypothetical protein
MFLLRSGAAVDILSRRDAGLKSVAIGPLTLLTGDPDIVSDLGRVP